MARQGTYVTVPGGSANWAKGIADSLSGLSRSYLEQGAAEDERARLAATEAENKRRWELDRQYKTDRAAIQDAQHAETQARLQEAHDAQMREREATEAKRKALLDVAHADVSKKAYDVSSYDPAAKDAVTSVVAGIGQEQADTYKFLQSGSEQDLTKATDTYRTNLERTGLDKASINNKVQDYKRTLLGFQNEFSDVGYTPEQRTARINQAVMDYYTPRLQALQESVWEGRGLTKGQKAAAITKDLQSKYRDLLTPAEIKAAVSENLGGTTREAMLAAEQSAVEKANEAELKNIELMDKYYQRAIAAKGKTSYSKSAKGVADALSDISDIDIGYFDTQDAKDGFNAMVLQHNLDPEIAAAAIKSGIDRGLVEDSFPSITSDKFAQLVQTAKKLQGAKSTTSSGRTYIDQSKYRYTPKTARGFGELQKSLLTVPTDTFREFDVKDSYRPDLTPPRDKAPVTVTPAAPTNEVEEATVPVVDAKKLEEAKANPSTSAFANTVEEDQEKLAKVNEDISVAVEDSKFKAELEEKKKILEEGIQENKELITFVDQLGVTGLPQRALSNMKDFMQKVGLEKIQSAAQKVRDGADPLQTIQELDAGLSVGEMVDLTEVIERMSNIPSDQVKSNSTSKDILGTPSSTSNDLSEVKSDTGRLNSQLKAIGRNLDQFKQLLGKYTTKGFSTPNFSDLSNATGVPRRTLQQMYKTIKDEQL